VAYSRAHLTQLSESYRKLRNTARFLLGNLADFEPARDTVNDLTDLLDQYLYGRTGEFLTRVRAAFDAYEFHVVFRGLVDFCTIDLSSLYCDVRKDRLYCDRKDGRERRATQTVLYAALRAITTAMAPILCFTADEIWAHMPRRSDDPDSVHLALLPPGWATEPGIQERMAALLDLRAEVQLGLEPFRAQKKSSLDARVALAAPPADAAWLADLLIVSEVVPGAPGAPLAVTDAGGHRCERCWKWTPDAPICARCRAALS
jgi:isoleucyl-tRNA synthetase